MVALKECGGESERGGGGVSKKETSRRIGSLGLYERFSCVGHMGLHVLSPTRIPLFLSHSHTTPSFLFNATHFNTTFFPILQSLFFFGQFLCSWGVMGIRTPFVVRKIGSNSYLGSLSYIIDERTI